MNKVKLLKKFISITLAASICFSFSSCSSSDKAGAENIDASSSKLSEHLGNSEENVLK